MRLRSIQRWLKDQPEPPPDLEAKAIELDVQMMEAFETAEDALKDRMMRAKTWGTAEGLQQFPMQRMELWQQVVADHLPSVEPSDSEPTESLEATSGLPLEG